MSINDINKNSRLKRAWIDKAKNDANHYYETHIDSLIPAFEKELRQMGFEFEISNQTLGFMPRHKKEILPIVIKYYELAKERQKFNEQNHFLTFFQYKGFEEIIPMLLEDFYSKETVELTRWFISDCIYQIRSKNFIKDYLDIVSNKKFGRNRQMIILLLGKLKEECAISTLVSLLEDEEVRLHAICALGEFKREEFRCYFERFKDSTNPGWRKYARIAINKLDQSGDGSMIDKRQ